MVGGFDVGVGDLKWGAFDLTLTYVNLFLKLNLGSLLRVLN